MTMISLIIIFLFESKTSFFQSYQSRMTLIILLIFSQIVFAFHFFFMTFNNIRIYHLFYLIDNFLMIANDEYFFFHSAGARWKNQLQTGGGSAICHGQVDSKLFFSFLQVVMRVVVQLQIYRQFGSTKNRDIQESLCIEIIFLGIQYYNIKVQYQVWLCRSIDISLVLLYFLIIFSNLYSVQFYQSDRLFRMSKPKQPPSKINSIFFTKNLTRLTNEGSYSLDLIDTRKNNPEIIQANQTMRLQKIKKQIYMHLTTKKDYIPGLPENLESRPSQMAYFNQEQTKYQSLMKRLRSHNGNHTHRSHQQTSNQKPSERKKQNNENKKRVMEMRKKNWGGGQRRQQFQQLHKRSFTIKEIKPEKKQRITKEMPICDPGFGKTYGSYYQIVAVQKKFFNSRYFMNGQALSMIGGGQYEALDQKYKSRIISNSPSPKRGSKIFYAKQGDVIEPWKLQDDSHLHDGFG